jgi:hypothetical protein
MSEEWRKFLKKLKNETKIFLLKLMRSDAEQTMQQINVTEYGVRREELESMFQELIKNYETLFHIFAFFKP